MKTRSHRHCRHLEGPSLYKALESEGLIYLHKRAGFIQTRITTRDDQKIKDTRAFLAEHTDIIPRLMRELSLFKQHKK
jgi:DNA-binding transcriptional regulator YhcF (GntR family)